MLFSTNALRSPLSALVVGALAVVVCVLAAGLTACGDNVELDAYQTYTGRVDALLEDEHGHWVRVAEFQRERQEDPALPRYYRFLRETAVPFYESLQSRLEAVVPGSEALADAHALLLRFSDERLEFVHSELAAEPIHARALEQGGIIAIFSGQDEAEALRIAYIRAVGAGAPDAKLGELAQEVDAFRRRYFEPMREGLKDAAEVQVQLRNSVIPALETLRRRKYGDDHVNQLLKQCVIAWLDWHRNLADVCPLYQEASEALARSQAAAKSAEESAQAFRDALAAIRREL